MQEKSINQDYFNLKTPQSFNDTSENNKEAEEDFVQRKSAAYGKQESIKSRTGTQHEFFANQDALRGDIASVHQTVNGVSEQFFDKSDAEFGRSQY